MKVVLAIPYWGKDPVRFKNYEYVYEYLPTLYPFDDILVGPEINSMPTPNRGLARNMLVDRAAEWDEADVVVLCDADTFPEESALVKAIQGAYWAGGLHFAYDNFQLLTDEGTQRLFRGDLWKMSLAAKGPGSLGGCMAIRPADWVTAGGSPELTGWGFEDVIFAVQARTFLTNNTWHPGTVTCLWHPTECRVGSDSYNRNIAVCKEVEALNGNPEGLRDYMNDSPYWR